MIETILAIILAYLYGAIPFCLLIGFYYKKDIRVEGSKNVGGSNLGRICGKKAFILGFTADMTKGAVVCLVGYTFGIEPLILLPVAIIGHSFSIFIKFKGGKGISTGFGFVLVYAPIGALFAISIFLISLYLSKYVSLSSILGVTAFFIYTLFYMQFFVSIVAFLIFVFVVYAHRENIKRIKNKTESKISWM
ncbi:MAG: glycerol-3-phosphate 1-O-acyltransferase PlsY [Mycoplasmatales bacterium]